MLHYAHLAVGSQTENRTVAKVQAQTPRVVRLKLVVPLHLIANVECASIACRELIKGGDHAGKLSGTPGLAESRQRRE